jgi:hypothetical protein
MSELTPEIETELHGIASKAYHQFGAQAWYSIVYGNPVLELPRYWGVQPAPSWFARLCELAAATRDAAHVRGLADEIAKRGDG